MCKIGNRLYSAALRLLNPARLFGAALVCCSALLAGCVNDDEPFAEPQKAVVQLSVGADAASQTGDQTTGALTIEESKLYTLRVYAFVGGRLAGHYFTDQVTMVDGKHTFYMDLTLYSTGEQKVDFYVIANENAMSLRRLQQGAENPDNVTLSETTSEDMINNVWFNDYIYPDVPTKGLPMYYKKSEKLKFDNTATETATGSGHEGHTLLNDKIDFALERPVGKTNVFVAKPKDETGTLRVSKLEIVGRGIPVRNYLMPQSDETLKEIQHGDYDVNIDLVKDADKNNAAITAEIDENDDRTDPANYTLVSAHPFYSYENPYENGGSWNIEGADKKGHVLRIEYDYDNKQTHTREIYMPEIVRNHYYAVCCLISNTGEIFITYNVMPWDQADEYNMEFEYPTYENPITPASGITPGDNEKYPQPKIWHDPTGSDESANATFRFVITGPVEMPWQPRLQENGATSADYKVEVYQLDENGNKIMKTDFDHVTPSKDDDLVPSDMPFFITVKAMTSRVGHQVGLGIAYSARWSSDYHSPLLLINGLTSKLAYEGSRFAEYILIEQVDVPTTQATEQQ